MSAVGGVIPLPLVNVAAVTALLVRMVKLLSQLYGVPFERNRARSIVIGLMGGALPTGFATIATSTLIYFMPGPESDWAGGFVRDRRAPVARSIGQRFVEHSRTGATLIDSALDRQALSRGPVRCSGARDQFGLLGRFSIFSIRLLGRMSVQFLLM